MSRTHEIVVASEQLTKALDEYEKAMHPLFEWAYDGSMSSDRFRHFTEYAEIMRRMILLREAINKQIEDDSIANPRTVPLGIVMGQSTYSDTELTFQITSSNPVTNDSPREKVQFLSGLGHTDADIWLIIDSENNLTSISRGNAVPKMGACVLTDGTTKYCIFHSIGKNREVVRSKLRDYLELRGEL